MSRERSIAVFIRGFHNGGIEKVFETYFTHMNLEPYEIHFVTHMESDIKREIRFRDMGLSIHRLSPVRGHKITPTNLAEYKKLFDEYAFDVVHNNMPDNLLPLFFARVKGVPCRILHAHSVYTQSFSEKSALRRCAYRAGFSLNASLANVLLCVSRDAARSAFGPRKTDKALLLPNAIDTKLFTYDETMRRIMRERLSLSRSLCIGHVGRFENDMKNQEILIQAMPAILETRPEARLLLIGDGPRRSWYQTLSREMGLEDSIVFTGSVSNVQEYLQAMDIFALPSRQEGLGIAAIEAQAAGLYCLVSDRVPHEVAVTDNVEFLSIDRGPQLWAEAILNNSYHERRDTSQTIRQSGYDINDQAKILDGFYSGIA